MEIMSFFTTGHIIFYASGDTIPSYTSYNTLSSRIGFLTRNIYQLNLIIIISAKNHVKMLLYYFNTN